MKNFEDCPIDSDTLETSDVTGGGAEGLAEGHVEEKKVIARKMKSKGFSSTDISEMTGLTEEEIRTL